MNVCVLAGAAKENVVTSMSQQSSNEIVTAPLFQHVEHFAHFASVDHITKNVFFPLKTGLIVTL